MSRTRQRALVSLLAAALIGIVPATVIAQEDALDRAVAAVGGADPLASLGTVVIEATGTRLATDEGPTPGGDAGPGVPFESTTTLSPADERMRVDYSIGATDFGAPREVSEIVVGDIGYVDGANSIVAPPGAAPLLSDRVMSIRTHQQLLNPHLLLLTAVGDPSMVTSGPDSVEIAHGPTPITLWLDADSGEITGATTMEGDPLRRDVELAVSYDDWTDTASGVRFPGSVAITYDGITVQEETRTVTTDAEIDASILEIPDGIDPVFDPDLATRGDVNHQYLQNFEAIGFPLDGRQLNVVATEVVGPGIFHITGGSHHSMAIIQDEGVVIVEGPLDERRSAAVLSWLERQAPGLPVTHIVQSHHHVDHSGGLRFLAGMTGATVVAGEAAVPFYVDEAFMSSSDVVPDGIDGSTIETIAVGATPFVIEAETNPVTVYPFPNPHAQDYVLVESNGALWVVDIYNPGLGFGAPPPELFAFVEDQGLEVFQVIGGHGGTDSWADLTAAG